MWGAAGKEATGKDTVSGKRQGFLVRAGSMPHFSELGQQDEDLAVKIFMNPARSTQSRHDQIKTNLSS